MKIQKRQQLQRRAQIFALQDALMSLPESLKAKEELWHHFARGLYAREMRVPAGTVWVGKIHKYPCLNFIMSGVAEIRSDQGAMRVKAPCVFESGSGTKRAFVAVTDLVWVTVHPTKETDLSRLEAELIAETYDQLPAYRVMVEADL